MPLLAPKQTEADLAQIVFILFTILYQLKTLTMQHKSPAYGPGFLLVQAAMVR